MLESKLLDEIEITRLTSNQLEIERLLSRLTTDEISSLLHKLDYLMSNLLPNNAYSDLIHLKIRVQEEKRLREEMEIS